MQSSNGGSLGVALFEQLGKRIHHEAGREVLGYARTSPSNSTNLRGS
jgi:hypothetical protein